MIRILSVVFMCALSLFSQSSFAKDYSKNTAPKINKIKNIEVSKNILSSLFHNMKCSADTPQFICAIKFADTATIKKMLNNGADVYMIAPDGRSAIVTAVMDVKDLDVIDVVLNEEIKQKGQISSDTFAAAINSDNTGFSKEFIVKKFITKGVDINGRTKFGFTPLMLAAFNYNTNVVGILLEAGADVNAKIKRGEYLQASFGSFSQEYIKQKELGEFMTEFSEQLSPLSIAIEINLNEESAMIANMLYKKGADVDYREFTDICLYRLSDIGNPSKKNPVTDDEEINKLLRSADRKYNEYLEKCSVLIDAKIIIKDENGHYKPANAEIKTHWKAEDDIHPMSESGHSH